MAVQLHCHFSSASSLSRLPHHPCRLPLQARHGASIPGMFTLQRGQVLEAEQLQQARSVRRGPGQTQCRKVGTSKQRGRKGGKDTGGAAGSLLASFLRRQSGENLSAKGGASRGPKSRSGATDKWRQSSKPAEAAGSWPQELDSLLLWLDNLLPEFFEDTRVERLSYAVFSVSVAFLVSSAFVNPTCVVSSSMAPTLLKGDCVLVDIFTVRLPQQPKKGDVVVFLPPSGFSTEGPTAEYVKRVIGTAGDTVEVSDGRVLVNGAPRFEEAARLGLRLSAASEAAAPSLGPLESFTRVSANKHAVCGLHQFMANVKKLHPVWLALVPLQPQYTQAKTLVPPGALYVLGDNRNKSADSHVWGFLPVDKVIGKGWIRFWPLSRLGLV